MAESTIFDAIADGMLRMAAATSQAAREIVDAASMVSGAGGGTATVAAPGSTTSTVELQPGKGGTAELAAALSATVGRT